MKSADVEHWLRWHCADAMVLETATCELIAPLV
jgi:hypothetical protein